MTTVPNIILFGETGCGKSSVVNLIAEQAIAPISSRARGCTFESTGYQVSIIGSPFNIYDTAGLDEAKQGQVPPQDAIVQLYKLIKNLDTGVSLLVYCMRAPRIKGAAYKNWRMFYEVLCRKQVPIVTVITGLEEEDVMDKWWYDNMEEFQRYEMMPSGFACITATRGKRMKSGAYPLEEEYEESKQKVWRLIKSTHLVRPWQVERVEWFSYIIDVTYEPGFCPWDSPTEHRDVRQVLGPGLRDLVTRCEMPEDEAKQLMEKLES